MNAFFRIRMLLKWIRVVRRAYKRGLLIKHCQRHNGPEDWVHLTKVTSWGHITNSNTNLDQISFSESRLISKSQPNITISTILKLKILTKPCAQSLNKSFALWPNQDLEVEERQYFEAGICSAFCRWSFVEVMKLNLGRDSGQDFEF